ncbi:LysM peptidoglycan-binding domain-containing protein [Calderihabitans maritimus]|uniref:LysM domain-containing protein n=1 Tax=Calderihabitans maritimus TaxID=1246530 RepID=A0A1Z5HUT5_9FIRM|nr:LysM domain-containing protein [Calderihabitans maritimus]GAW93299.1 hypothetical protein PTH_1110 [Calderihabitans maritimus]
MNNDSKNFWAIIISGVIIAAAIVFVFAGRSNLGGNSEGNGVSVNAPIVNGDFQQDNLGWSPYTLVKTEKDGNKYTSNYYNWDVNQILNLIPGQRYVLRAKTRRGTAQGPARFVIGFIGPNRKELSHFSFRYLHRGDGWEEIPPQLIEVPPEAVSSRIYLLTDDDYGTHDFDDIYLSLLKPGEELPATPMEEVKQGEEEVQKEEKAEGGNLVSNGDFETNQPGWSMAGAVIQEDPDGNHFARVEYSWEFFQPVELQPGGQYVLTGRTRKGTAQGEARFKLVFFDDRGWRLQDYYSILYKHKGNGWENLPPSLIKVPAEAAEVRLYLLANSDQGYHDFDDLSLVPLAESSYRPDQVRHIGYGTVLETQSGQKKLSPPVPPKTSNKTLPPAQSETAVSQAGSGPAGSESEKEKVVVIVKAGDTLSLIAQEFNTTVEEILKANNLTDPNRIYPGQKLVIPREGNAQP